MAKFKSLVHNGPVFPKEYERKKFKKSTPILDSLSALAEEMLWNWATKRDTDYVKDVVFQRNFWSCLKPEMPKQYQSLNFPVDFKKEIDIMFNMNEEIKQAKKDRSKAEKDKEKNEKAKLKDQYGFAYLDGKKQPLGGYLIEPPGIIFTRGDSPIRGLWKYRTVPEDITINCSQDVPCPIEGHHWAKVEFNPNAFQTCSYNVNVGNKTLRLKRILFGATSSVKVGADQKKFDKAVKLVKNWGKVEKHIAKGLKSKDNLTRQNAAIAWLIQYSGIRIGNDHTELEAQTCGASTLLCRDVELI